MQQLGHLRLGDGEVISVQASSFHYCTPREDFAPEYSHVEVASFGKGIPELADYAENAANPPAGPEDVWVYPYTPTERVEALIAARGGLAENLGKRILF
jgi:hypothetical protein